MSDLPAPTAAGDGEAPAATPATLPAIDPPAEASRWVWLPFWLLVAGQLALVWSFPFPPTQDGPVHLENARILLLHERTGGELLRGWYELRPLAPPIAGLLPLSALLAVASAATAERLFVSAYLLLFAAAIRGAMPGRGGAVLAPLALPFALGYLFHLGFYSFGLGLVGFLAVVAVWRQGPAHGVRGTLRLGGLVTLAWAAHPVPAVAAAPALAAATLCSVYATAPRGRRVRELPRQLVPLLLAFLPAALLTAGLRHLQGPTRPVSWPLGRRLQVLVSLDSVPAFDRRELAVSLGLAFTLLVLSLVAIAGRRAGRWRAERLDGLLVAAVAVALLALVVPNGFTSRGGGAGGTVPGGWLVHRLSLLPPLLGLAWLAGQPLPVRARRWARLAGVALVSTQLGLHAASWLRHHDLLREVEGAAAVIPAGATYLPISFADRGAPGLPVSAKVATFQHALSRLAAEETRVDLSNYQAQAGGLFPVVFLPEVDPSRHMPPLHVLPGGSPVGDLLGYEAATGRSIDYVAIWGWHPAMAEDPRFAPLVDQLATGWDVVWASPRGWARIWGRRPRASAGPDAPPTVGPADPSPGGL